MRQIEYKQDGRLKYNHTNSCVKSRWSYILQGKNSQTGFKNRNTEQL